MRRTHDPIDEYLRMRIRAVKEEIRKLWEEFTYGRSRSG